MPGESRTAKWEDVSRLVAELARILKSGLDSSKSPIVGAVPETRTTEHAGRRRISVQVDLPVLEYVEDESLKFSRRLYWDKDKNEIRFQDISLLFEETWPREVVGDFVEFVDMLLRNSRLDPNTWENYSFKLALAVGFVSNGVLRVPATLEDAHDLQTAVRLTGQVGKKPFAFEVTADSRDLHGQFCDEILEGLRSAQEV